MINPYLQILDGHYHNWCRLPNSCDCAGCIEKKKLTRKQVLSELLNSFIKL